MAHNKLYRNFIILQEDERGYSHSNDKALSGYAKVEAKGDKCKVSFYAQNLRQEDNYSMVLICCKRDLKQLIDLGPLAINEVGKGDTSKEYYVNNIAGLGISYDKISGAAICKAKDNEVEFIMHGFMNGEDSADNWRKFKLVKVDSKKYINKFESEPKNKEIISSDVVDKVIVSKPSNLETKVVEIPKSESVFVERKQEETYPKSKENIQANILNEGDSKVNNRVPENHQSITETISPSDEDRNKCKDAKKADIYDKHDKCEKAEDIEEAINKLAKKLDTYDGIIDLKINSIHDDVIIYGFIKEKKNCNCKWKKFKVEKKCRSDREDIKYSQGSSRRIEENFELDKLSDINRTSKIDRLDIVDFDEYESNIQISSVQNENQSDTGIMGQIGTTNAGQLSTENIGQIETTNIDQTGTTSVDQPSTGMMDQVDTTSVGEQSTGIMDQVDTTSVGEQSTGIMDQAGTTGAGEQSTGIMDQMDTTSVGEQGNGVIDQTGTTSVGQQGTVVMDQIGTTNMDQTIPSTMQPTTSAGQNFKLTGEISLYFEKLAEGFEPYNGSLADINYCKLYKINVNSMKDLSDDSNYNQYTLAYYPMLNYYPYISKNGHFLLGYKCNGNGEMKYIIYAIPGSKEKSDQPYGGRTGFVTWTSDNKSGRGYWLMFYDFKNSSIVIPTK